MPFPFISSSLNQALSERGYQDPTPVQQAVLEAQSGTRDLLVSAQTGSGKTVAYGLAMGHILLKEEAHLPPPSAPMALVIAPTRELALQVQQELVWLYKPARAQIASCIGGMDARKEARHLQQGCHIVVGTPGRLCDHLRRGRLDLSQLEVVVLDEADEMLDLGFRDELEELLSAMPDQRTTMLFSATLAKDIISLAKRYQKDALRIDTSKGAKQHADIDYQVMLVSPREVEHAVVNILRFYESTTAMVFCATRELVRHMQSALLERGFSSVALSGELGQTERSRAIESLRTHQTRVCVATDVAARGLDLPALGLVIHASLPTNAATLLHRSGRTGRAGRKGICAIITPVNQQRKAERLLSAAKVSAQWGTVPTSQQIHEKDTERLLTLSGNEDNFQTINQALVARLIAERSTEQLAQALVMLYQAHLPEPEEVRQVTAESPSFKKERKPGFKERDYKRDNDEPRERHTLTQGKGTWFNLPVGRADKADPKWLVPLLCKIGGIKKRDIGTIKIQDDHTAFEIAPEYSERFMNNVALVDGNDLPITPMATPSFTKKSKSDFGAKGSFGKDKYAKKEKKSKDYRDTKKERPFKAKRKNKS